MILIFLGDWRPTIVISISIPLSIFVSVLLLSALGETINIMTLGGLALAVGILVDDATVEIENIERNLAQGKEMQQAILDGAAQIAVPAFVSTLCICIVFVPMFFLTGVARFLFVPLAEAVVFAMLASYFLSRTLVPTLVMYHACAATSTATAGRRRFRPLTSDASSAASTGSATATDQLLETTLEHRKVFAICFCRLLRALDAAWCSSWARTSSPASDAGQMRLHVRAPRRPARGRNGAAVAIEVEAYLRTQIPKEELVTILDNIGLPNSGINLSYSNSGVIGTSDAEILVALEPGAPSPDRELHSQAARGACRGSSPAWSSSSSPPTSSRQILNFGLPAPHRYPDLIGADMTEQLRHRAADRQPHARQFPGTADVHVQQLLDLPTLHLDIDRNRVHAGRA